MGKVLLFLIMVGVGSGVVAEPLSPEQKASVEAKLTALKAWGSTADVVEAVKATAPAWSSSMDQDHWKGLSILSAEVKELSKNGLANWMRAKKDPTISEAFVSRADGTKVAFLGKPTSWSHKGKPKHDLPMAGKTWIGEIETDESTGVKQVQVAFPIVDGTKVIGSMVVGLQLSKL